MTVVKTYKLEPETIQNLQKICEELELTWDGTFTTLANLYAQQKAIGTLPERGAEIKEFQGLLNQLSASFTHALQLNANTEERVRQEYARRLAAQEAALEQAQEKAKEAGEQARQAGESRQEAVSAQEKLQKANDALQAKLTALQTALQQERQEHEAVLADKEQLQALLSARVESLQQELVASRQHAKEEEAARVQLQELASSLQQEKAAHRETKQQLQRAEEDRQAMEKRLAAQSAQQEQELDLLRARAENEKQSALLQVREELVQKLDAMHQQYAAELARVYGAMHLPAAQAPDNQTAGSKEAGTKAEP